MIECDEETYITASEVARRLKISYGTCKSNAIPLLAECYLPGRKRPVYRQLEVEQLLRVRIVEKQSQPSILVREAAS